MRSLSTLLAAAAVLALTSGAAQAQTRDGFFVGFGAGWGSAGINCDECDLGSDRQGSFTGHLRLGKTITSRLALGLELNGWFDSDEDTKTRLLNATAAFYIYPSDAGLFVKAGAGVARTELEAGGDLANLTLSGTGVGLMAGVGYDVPIGSTATLTPVITYWYGQPGDLKFEGVALVSGLKHNVIELGVGVSFY